MMEFTGAWVDVCRSMARVAGCMAVITIGGCSSDFGGESEDHVEAIGTVRAALTASLPPAAPGYFVDGERGKFDFGMHVVGAGDVNADGFDDALIWGREKLGRDIVGKAFVVYGKRGRKQVELSQVAAGVGGFEIHGGLIARYDNFVRPPISAAGDVNGDGFDDVLVGVGYHDEALIYVIFGKADGAKVELADVGAGVGGFAIDPEDGEYGGWRSIAAAGDMNQDGLDDILIGDEEVTVDSVWGGRAYVVYGKTDNEPVSLAAVGEGNGGFAINPFQSLQNLGSAVSAAGDVNGDGLPDIIVGSRGMDINLEDKIHVGVNYVVFGKKRNTNVNVSAIARGVGGFSIVGEFQSFSGFNVGGGFDVNADGFDDLLVSSDGDELNELYLEGRAYVVHGKPTTEPVDLTDVAAGAGGGFAVISVEERASIGAEMAALGDFNADGFDDFVVGDSYGDDESAAYVIFGKAGTEPVVLSEVAGSNQGIVFAGQNPGDHLGTVSRAGDVNADGREDLLIGASGFTNGRIDRNGRTYVVFAP